MNKPDALIGQTIKGYRIIKMIGEGGFGAVYQAYQTVINRPVAIKVIWPVLANDIEFIRQFESEARIIASLEHSGIVPLYDYWRDPSGAYMVMRLFKGGSLRSHINHPWSAEQIVQNFIPILNAVAFAHRYGVIHRDIKPENILLDEDLNAYLGDFGIAISPENNLLQNPMFQNMGTVEYAAPEQLTTAVFSSKTDQYSLGVVLFELLTKKGPIPDINKLEYDEIVKCKVTNKVLSLQNLRPDLPSAFCLAVMRAISPHSTDRYPDVAAFSTALQNTLEFRLRQRSENDFFLGELAAKSTGKPASANQESTNTKVLPTFYSKEPNPYRGLRSFDEGDAVTFFGREGLIEHLLNRLNEIGMPSVRFLAVVGPSGSGKSSLVKAGLIPALRRGGVAGSRHWWIVDMKPGVDPFEELTHALSRIMVTSDGDLLKSLRGHKEGLLETVHKLLPQPEAELLLVIDQFEELFNNSVDQSLIEGFLNSLYTALMFPNSQLRVIVTLRADFYDRPLLYENFSQLMRQRTEVVTPMTLQELELAVVGPASLHQVYYEKSVVEAILHEMQGQLGALPLLQYGLTELYEHRQETLINEEAYRAAGGILGTVAKRCEELYLNLDLQNQLLTQQIFLRLIQLGEGAEDTRRRAALAELHSISQADSVDNIIDVYTKSRLLTLDRDPISRHPMIEIAHEALLREWERLRQWLKLARGDIRMQRTLAALATDWKNAQQDHSFLLRGGRLEQFETWLLSNPRINLSGNETYYFQESVRQRESEVRQEQLRLNQQRRLEQHARNRLVFLLVGSVCAALVLSVLTLLTLNAYHLADAARATSDANALRSQSSALLANAQASITRGDLDLGLALGLAANQLPIIDQNAERFLRETAYAPGTRRLYQGHTGSIRDVLFAPDGASLFSAAEDGLIIQWDVATDTILRRYEGHTEPVRGIVITQDGQRLYSASADNRLMEWNVQTGTVLRTFEGHREDVYALALTPDETHLLSASADQTLLLWNVSTGEIERTFEGHTGAVRAVAITPDGTRAISGAEDQTLMVWDLMTGETLHTLEGHTGVIRAVDVSPDGRYAISAGEDNLLILWDLFDGISIRAFQGHTAPVMSVEFNPTGRTIVSGGTDNRLILWDVNTGSSIRSFISSSGIVFAVSFSPSGLQVLSGHDTNVMRLWDLYSEGLIQHIYTQNYGFIRVDYLPDGNHALVVQGPTQITDLSVSGNSILLFDLESGEQIRQLQGHFGPIVDIAVSADGQLAASASTDSSIILWDLNTGQILHRMFGHNGFVFSVAFSPDGALMVSAGTDSSLILWDVAEGTPIQSYHGHQGRLLSVQFSPDGRSILSAGEDEHILLWDVESGEVIRRFEGHGGVVSRALFIPNSSLILSSSFDRQLILWNVETGEPERILTGHEGVIADVALSSDGRYAATSSEDQTIIVWDLSTGVLLRQLEAHTGLIGGVSFNPTEPEIISAGLDGSLFTWHLFQRSTNEVMGWIHDNRYVPVLNCDQFSFETNAPCQLVGS
jgi:WD40 repeat protein/serine/threonine protein kinase/energy-coupling factor transporter ATP-binding protein EcfA2